MTDYPKLAAATATKPVIILGGLPVPQKVRAVRDLGVEAEWPDAYHDAIRSLEAIASRLRGGKCPGLIILHRLLGHKSSKPLLDVCRLYSIPVAYAGKGGLGELRGALAELERRVT
jgi:hypothetical protein